MNDSQMFEAAVELRNQAISISGSEDFGKVHLVRLAGVSSEPAIEVLAPEDFLEQLENAPFDYMKRLMGGFSLIIFDFEDRDCYQAYVFYFNLRTLEGVLQTDNIALPIAVENEFSPASFEDDVAF